MPVGHQLELSIFDERNLVVCQFDCVVLHNYPDTSLILRTDDIEEADILLHEYQNYELKFLSPDESIKKLELEWDTIDPLRLILHDTDQSPVVRGYYPGGEAWNIYRELEAIGRQASLEEFCVKLHQDNYGFLSKISYVPRAILESPSRVCYCKGTSHEHQIGSLEDCAEVIKTTRRLEYNPLLC